jgi:FKBP-type peptidyl-prolyl cis-trans isomerase FkpA
MKKGLFIICFSFTFVFFSCQSNDEKQSRSSKVNIPKAKEKLVRTNQYLVKAEEQSIQDFIKRYKYDMTETGSGLLYEIYKNGEGPKAEKGKIAELKFQIRLLNGEVVYESDNDGVKEFLIGKGGVESGLEEGILLLQVGDRARFILPSHLAFGLLGDLQKIPERSAIVYDLELLNLK